MIKHNRGYKTLTVNAKALGILEDFYEAVSEGPSKENYSPVLMYALKVVIAVEVAD